MNIRKKLTSLLLAGVLALSLVACSDAEVPSEPAPSPETTADSTGLPEDFVVNPAAEDICLETTGIPGNFPLIFVNGNPVSTCTYLYWLADVIAYMEETMASYGVTIDWSTDASYSEYATESALASCVRYSLVEAKAKELGFSMTQEQIDELEATLALSAEYMGGQEAFQEQMRRAGLDYDTVYNVNAVYYYLVQLQAGLFPDPPTDTEMDAYIEEEDLLRAKHILLMTVDSVTYQTLDDETIAQKKATAEDILAQLQSSTNLEADFDALMHEYSEDGGLSTNPDGYVFTAGEMVTEFESGTRALEFGQISGIVESPYGYHIILRLDPDTETMRQDYESDRLSDQIELWTSEAEIVLAEEYESFDMPLFYEKYVAYQEAFAAEDQAALEAESKTETTPEADASAEG